MTLSREENSGCCLRWKENHILFLLSHDCRKIKYTFLLLNYSWCLSLNEFTCCWEVRNFNLKIVWCKRSILSATITWWCSTEVSPYFAQLCIKWTNDIDCAISCGNLRSKNLSKNITVITKLSIAKHKHSTTLTKLW